MNILMVASENDGLKGGKVGGIGDVVRDVPPSLAMEGLDVSVVTPSYGFLHRVPGARPVRSLTFRFGGTEEIAEVYEVPGKQQHRSVTHFVVDHPGFVSYELGRYQIYCDDPPLMPHARDATKFALFCLAVAEAVKRGVFGALDCLHLHDWHAAFLLVLRKYHPAYESLRGIRTAFTIHNLAIQGVRPFEVADSSLAAWYPELVVDRSELADPRWKNCLNPMAIGIRLADAVHTVSPSYADEILLPSEKPRYYGGEGLEPDLQSAHEKGRLFGILNGCEYPEDRVAPRMEFPALLKLLEAGVLEWAGSQSNLMSSHFLAHSRLSALAAASRKPKILLTSVSRVVDQKMLLMVEPDSHSKSGLQGILEVLGDRGIYILLGTGDKQYEQFLTRMSGRFDNFIFLNGYSDACAAALYANGSLFLMPSSFEPCGISQMLAMRDGQPCLAHKVGGLKDTIEDGVNGFLFNGATVKEQVDDFVWSLREALHIEENDPGQWGDIRLNAAGSRFLWQDTVRQYMEKLYKKP